MKTLNTFKQKIKTLLYTQYDTDFDSLGIDDDALYIAQKDFCESMYVQYLADCFKLKRRTQPPPNRGSILSFNFL